MRQLAPILLCSFEYFPAWAAVVALQVATSSLPVVHEEPVDLLNLHVKLKKTKYQLMCANGKLWV